MEGKNHAVQSTGTRIMYALLWVFLLLVAALTLYPLLYVIFGSFKTNQELLIGGIDLLPKTFVLDNYIEAWEKANFGRYTINSIVISLGVMILSVLVTSMAAYVLARKDFKGKDLIYNTLIAFMFINVGSVSLRPLFELAVDLNMHTSLWSVIIIITGMGQATYIFLIRGFMLSVPKELDEAAKIDGCSFFQIYYRIILPVLKPILATVALLSFRAGWNEYIIPLVFTMSNEVMRPLTVGVVMLQNSGNGAAAWNIMFAGSALSIIPIVLVYLFLNKYFVSGLTAGAVKG
ncbi:MAG: carbohydrate ABC transporter permease [Clostridiales bacterium]|nr:carbohydrate ABC transporter permease [Clostridiales bacterium]